MANDRTAETARDLTVETTAVPLDLRWHSSSSSKLGFVRAVNEDALLDAREQNLWVVAVAWVATATVMKPAGPSLINW